MTRQSFLSSKHAADVPATAWAPGRGGRSRFSEVAGRTTAECTALCCCCPCSVINILVLAVYKVPARLCRKASRRRKLQRSVAKKRTGTLCPRPVGVDIAGAVGTKFPDGCDVGYATEDSVADLLKSGDVEGRDDAAGDLERKMFDRFHGAGFWRSPSMRDT